MIAKDLMLLRKQNHLRCPKDKVGFEILVLFFISMQSAVAQLVELGI